MIQPKAKRLKLGPTQDQEVQNNAIDENNDELKGKSPKSSPSLDKPSLLSLYTECCLHIFEMLPLNDLCSVSKTCKRFQALGKDVYRRRYKSKVLIIEDIADDGNMALGPDEKYTNCFAEFIQNVSLSQNVASKAGLARLKAFYKAKAKDEYDSGDENENSQEEQSSDESAKKDDGPISTPITSLRFENWRGGLRKSHGPVLADIVQGVEAVTFSSTKISGDLNENMLQFLPNMKRLTLWKTLNEPRDDERVNWMEQTYPKLEHFAWHLYREVPVNKVKRFLQVNPSIKTFSLLSKSPRTINELVNEGMRIDELFFDIPSDLWNALADLRLFCQQQVGRQLKLHLKFSDSVRASLNQNLNLLTAIAPYIEGLYFEEAFVDEKLVKVIEKCEHLKMIQLNLQPKGKMMWLTNIPKLQEIFIYWAVNLSTFGKYHKVMMMLAGQVQQLKKIYIRNNSRKFNEFGLDELNSERRKLTDTKRLKIYFKSEETINTGRLDATVCEFDKIEALRVESETFDNPLVTKYLTTKGLPRFFYRHCLRIL
ncbi:uncharacterized protein LOC129565465 [Sitodiplosis mosellana]|uniref:uncharacterized protein LOC129565465 n=1 Tax=Sitodiplosis mosellana TaxID=263140 RepID=UPI002445006F|nr:uncharacterized protein LOC129565465 [Sitodiplosis mosellana]